MHQGTTGIWLPLQAGRDGELRSDGGGLLLWELVLRAGLCRRPSEGLRDHRESRQARHAVEVPLAADVLIAALALTVDTDPAAHAGAGYANPSESCC